MNLLEIIRVALGSIRVNVLRSIVFSRGWGVSASCQSSKVARVTPASSNSS